MQLLLYILVYPLLWIISILPFRLLYLLSDFVYLLLYNVIGYRKNTVRHNLALAFPEMPENERLDIEKKSYRHLCDMFLEMVKSMSISEKEINKRFEYTNLQTFIDLEKRGKSIALMCAHYASYEWVMSLNLKIDYDGYVIYKRISNKYFDKLVHKIRSRFNVYLVSTKDTIFTIQRNMRNGIHGVYGFAADQSPKANKAFHWATFMGIDSPVYTGAELLAKRFDMPVIFLNVRKVKRGYYKATFELLAETPGIVPDYEITEKFLKLVEKEIHQAPEYYLWTHKRWKHSGKKPTS